MTADNFLKEHKSKLKQIKKLNVRDLDTIDKNQYVAYVDDTKDSYDVQIKFDQKKNIIDTQCDCMEGGICTHIIALVHFLSTEKKVKEVIKKPTRKKVSEIDQIIESLDHETLKNWLSEALTKNKDLAFLFKTKFSLNNTVIDQKHIKKIVNENIVSVIGKRKKVELSELKKIIESLNIVLEPIFLSF